MRCAKINPLFSLWLLVVFSIGCKHPNNQLKYIIELIGSEFDLTKIQSIAHINDVNDTQLYRWKNHVVMYSQIQDVERLSKQLKTEFPDLEIKIYDRPFYNFSKEERCANASVSPEWEHILLTANLVKEEALQKAYLHYHKTQFEEWPEVSQGFCNAGFQELLVYKNKRQLMLVISIPKGTSLDELNPKTIENNPRMVEWNQMMGKYQEGIAGTQPGEKWVFLNKVE